eukprot:2406518-Pleurochrysis_carterae.AAC.2
MPTLGRRSGRRGARMGGPPHQRAAAGCVQPVLPPIPPSPAGTRPNPPRPVLCGNIGPGRHGSAFACPWVGPPAACV